MSSGGEIARCREVVKERRAPAVFGAAWQERGVDGWADADLLTSLALLQVYNLSSSGLRMYLPGAVRPFRSFRLSVAKEDTLHSKVYSSPKRGLTAASPCRALGHLHCLF